MKMTLIINEQHTLMADQERVLRAAGWTGETIRAPVQGWTLAEMQAMAWAWDRQATHPRLVFASPIGALMALCARHHIPFACLHNDRRESIETTLPDGSKRLQHRIAAEGWQIAGIELGN